MSTGAGAVKRCRPFLQRAEELGAHEPVVAYYCRVHAVEILAQAYRAGDNGPEVVTLLTAEMTKAEDAKKVLDLSQGQEAMQVFALQIFDSADVKDRAGCGDAGVAHQFYVASQFVDACAQFFDGELPPDLQEKSKYAKYRAMQIRESVRQGVSPAPPPAGGSAAAPAAPGSGAAAAEAAAAPPLLPLAATPAVTRPTLQPAAGVRLPSSGDGIAGARKQAEYAASALDFGDVTTARQCLHEALRLLDSGAS